MSDLPGESGPIALGDVLFGAARTTVGGATAARLWRAPKTSNAPITVGPIAIKATITAAASAGDMAVISGVGVDKESFVGVVRVSTFQVWRLKPTTSNGRWVLGTFAIDGNYVHLGEADKSKDLLWTARRIVRFDLSKIGELGELVDPVGP